LLLIFSLCSWLPGKLAAGNLVQVKILREKNGWFRVKGKFDEAAL
jgi:hypothetical protein